MKPPSSFIAITSEGGLLPADFLTELLSPKSSIDGLTPQSYNLAEGERINEQINRSWYRLKACWENFQKAIKAKQPGDPTTTETRDRWLHPLFQELGFGQRLPLATPIEVDGRSYPVSHGWSQVPIHLVGSHIDLDRRTPGAAGAAKASPHSLVQQTLNASQNHLWGIVSNGFSFRLLRNNIALTRLSYVEWDLATLFDGDLYSEFFILWLVCHQSRFAGERQDQCRLEHWKKTAEEKGLRALKELHPGVARAIEALGVGLVSHPANRKLCARLRSGELSTQEFYRQVLRVVYRMLFLFVAEDRDLLHLPLPDPNESKQEFDKIQKARQRYRDYYSITRMRGLTLHRAGTPHPDLWHIFQLLTQKLGSDTGCPELALPALGSFLWDAARSTPELTDTQVSNRQLLSAVHALSFVQDGSVRRPIDYKNLGSEELGSVYEGLLELHPLINTDTGAFELNIAAGNERKTSGSYYTPDSLVQCLLDSALEPVMAEAIRGKQGQAAAEALLKLKICDPAVGSGHFLISAAHRLAKRVAAARTGEEEPSPQATRTALRDVIGRCLYGVDINPMSAELCRVSLWLEALEPGKPLSFLDHHIRCGNSLLGTTPDLIKGGIPDDAYQAIEGDDKEACTTLKKKNKRENPKLGEWFTADEAAIRDRLFQAAGAIDEISDSRPQDIHRKEAAFRAAQTNQEFQKAKTLADLWCAAFVIKKQFPGAASEISNLPSQVTSLPVPTATQTHLFGGTEETPKAKAEKTKALTLAGSGIPIGITTRHLRDFVEGGAMPDGLLVEAKRLADQYQFFHFHLAFPEVSATGGFDILLGNPPWDKIQPEEEKFFASVRPDIANAETAKLRKQLIALLPIEDPTIHVRWVEHRRDIDGLCHFLKSSGALRFTGEGNLNSYRVFTELSAQLLAPKGRAGLVVQTGLATDESAKELFDHLLSEKRLLRFLDFENRQAFFTDVHQQFRFSLITLGGPAAGNPDGTAEFGWLLHSLEELAIADRLLRLSASDLVLFNPSSKTCPVFSSTRDFALSKIIYQHGQHICIDDAHRLGEVNFLGEMFNMTRDSGHFRKEQAESTLPLYEAKFIHQFDHRFATTEKGDVRELDASEKALPTCLVTPKSWVAEAVVKSRASKRGIHLRWMAGFRSIASPTNERTAIFAVFPLAGVGNSINMVLGLSAKETAFVMANANATVFDFCARQKLSGSNVNIWIFKQLPAIAFQRYSKPSLWSGGKQTLHDWLLPRVLEMTYTAWDLEAFAQDCGWSGPPFRWDEERRFLLRCELDAAFFHLYLGPETEWRQQPTALTQAFPTPRSAVSYIMDTFPIVKRKDEAKYDGDYRTKRVILEIYDALTQALQTGQPYQTRLNPAPASIAVAHLPQFERERVNLPAPGDYILCFVGSLLRHLGGEVDLMHLVQAYTLLLGDRKPFTELAKARFGQPAANWVRRFSQSVDAGWFLPILRGLENRDVLKLEERGEADVFVRLLDTKVPTNPTVETDVYLLLHSLDLMNSPLAPDMERIKLVVTKPLRIALREAEPAYA